MRPNPHSTHGISLKFGNGTAKLVAVTCDPAVARVKAVDLLRRAAFAGHRDAQATVIRLGEEPTAEATWTINGRQVVKAQPHLLS